jgi:Tfp pilus assembly protein PilV
MRLRSRPGLTALLHRLRDPAGLGLVELLIALMVLNIGIFATLAAFNSGALALRRASHVSAAAAVADKQLEAFRDMPYANLPTASGSSTGAGPDGRQYTVAWEPAAGSQTTGIAGVTYAGNSAVTRLTIRVYDVADNNKLLVTNSSTFEKCTQDRTTTACGG